ncbi:hypothetical protein ASD45_08410 [Pseudolabrys sp. Root1462]|uniref:hypothetical protein n=1 Tax=Pseudolabrys sp. Root1462 TaxID=1736466 RepID=UPI00070257F7|nr:hypothetical protein [Pseudolabrys sp. Root1462]KQZ00875.1 hypothetical protein ASD45_08410 [Pseudolabrys sp. Root1462]
MSSIPELTRRPLPSFDEWLNTHGNGKRGDGFEAFRDLAERTHVQKLGAYDEATTSFFRMVTGFQIAIVELCNIEERFGRKPHEIISVMPRALACCAVYATASVLQDEAPMRRLAKILTEEFRFAAKEAADQIEARKLKQSEASDHQS